MEKKTYTTPKCEITKFEAEDIICASGETPATLSYGSSTHEGVEVGSITASRLFAD